MLSFIAMTLTVLAASGQGEPEPERIDYIEVYRKHRAQILYRWFDLSKSCKPGEDVIRLRETKGGTSDFLHSMRLEKNTVLACSLSFSYPELPYSREICEDIESAAWLQLEEVFSQSSFWDLPRESGWNPGRLMWTLDACISGVYHSVSVHPHRTRALDGPANEIRQLVKSIGAEVSSP